MRMIILKLPADRSDAAAELDITPIVLGEELDGVKALSFNDPPGRSELAAPPDILVGVVSVPESAVNDGPELVATYRDDSVFPIAVVVFEEE